MVVCFILGEDVKKRLVCDISVKMWNYMKIWHLRNKIKEDASLSIPAQNLRLWKVNIPIKDENDEKMKILISKPPKFIDIEVELDGELLQTSNSIRNEFQKFPANTHIHIIVQLPLTSNMELTGHVHIIKDVYNIHFRGKKNIPNLEDLDTGVDKKGRLTFEKLRIDYGRLLNIILGNREVGEIPNLVGSRPPSCDSLWLIERDKFKIKYRPGTLVLVSDDKDLHYLCQKALGKHWKVEIWSWTTSVIQSECTSLFLKDYYKLFSYGYGPDLTNKMQFIDISNGNMFDNHEVVNWFVKIGLFCWLSRKNDNLRLYFRSNQDLYKVKNWIIENCKEVHFGNVFSRV
ncbi:hypothetical protein RclHR1_23980002 [Rhizophagus clarus]|uniref:Crinkler effector protein N-terminal domain-containing protein n=1 Tax=Rhizophagus clarus TaxID=94130 RepID=A0A2Z6QYH5_9GLOM|nr:hypothetical protein RclHR1_23980002 [Rhizophagus clarus]GES99283.1 hypothetical protein GLOIN_2v1775552 [Rhizophagus clarus]